ncbi:hypothetical protein LCGC14_0344360 [marine sediment metagenome]|uniref:Uncharacterized protein n=1 Tax=marine sediment metagenome TaxID=412755 RepID=A0A0F9TCJ4_9ZZZZ
MRGDIVPQFDLFKTEAAKVMSDAERLAASVNDAESFYRNAYYVMETVTRLNGKLVEMLASESRAMAGQLYNRQR